MFWFRYSLRIPRDCFQLYSHPLSIIILVDFYKPSGFSTVPVLLLSPWLCSSDLWVPSHFNIIPAGVPLIIHPPVFSTPYYSSIQLHHCCGHLHNYSWIVNGHLLNESWTVNGRLLSFGDRPSGDPVLTLRVILRVLRHRPTDPDYDDHGRPS